jgi:proteic killer suppression protein
MIVSFKNQATEDIFNGINNKDARNLCPKLLWKIAFRKLDQLDSVIHLEELRIPPGNRLEVLSGKRDSEFNIRINEQYRICFQWIEASAHYVEITDYH